MVRRVAELDWSRTALGHRAEWSSALRTAVDICLSSRHPMVIWWGPELVLVYNDGWMPILGPVKHPALGRPGAQVWPEMWHIIGAQLEGVLHRGEATWSDDQLLPADRFGYLEEAYFTYSYSPIREQDGRVAGVFTAVTETTGRVLGERRLATLRDLGEVPALGSATAEEACAAAVDALAGHRADVPFSLVYLLDDAGGQARLVADHGLRLRRDRLPTSIPLRGPAGAEPLDALVESITAAASSRRPGTATDLARRSPGVAAPGANPVGDADVDEVVVLPLATPGQDRVAGVVVLGVSPYRELDGEYRSFLSLVGGHIATAVADVQAYEAERRRARSLAELDRAKTEFFTGVSHELRTPLTLIAGPVQDALDDTAHPLPAVHRNRLDVVRRNSGRLRRLVDTMLDFARLEGGRLTAQRVPVDLSRLTRGIAESFAPAAHRAGLRFVVDRPDPPLGALVDPDMWEKVVLNLLSNAVKYTLRGTVTIGLRGGGDGEVLLAVSDTGAGIAEADLSRIFERFHRVESSAARSVEGSGIGLALVTELVGLHQGRVRAVSEPGRGRRSPSRCRPLPGPRRRRRRNGAPPRSVSSSTRRSSGPRAPPGPRRPHRWTPGTPPGRRCWWPRTTPICAVSSPASWPPTTAS
jgi:signal transduction histidine kinase